MKAIDIALKDLQRSFRSAFAIIFMFGIPLLIAGMFYLMFGNIANNDTGITFPQTQVVIANLDAGSEKFQAAIENSPNTLRADSLGQLIVGLLKGDMFKDLMTITVVNTPEEARQSVDAQQAGIAIIIPEDFSAKYSTANGQAVMEVYQDPTLTIGPAIVRSVLNQFINSLSGSRITASIVTSYTGGADETLMGKIVQDYVDFTLRTQDTSALVAAENPAAPEEKPNIMLSIIGPIFGGMIIFYAFYTGTSAAESILREDEIGTLPRLFTTPTKQSTILTGKLLAVFLTVLVQIIVLITLGWLIFRIPWGGLASIACLVLGTVVAASSFGIFINSLLKNTKQGGVIFGGVLTVSGMLGMIKIFTMSSPTASTVDIVSLFVPQGWAVRAMLQSMTAAPMNEVLLTLAVTLTWGIVFFIAGVLRFQKRYA